MSDPAWQKNVLGNIARIYVGGTPSTDFPDYWGPEIPWMNSGDLHHKIIIDLTPRITTKGLQASAAQLVEAPTVAIGLVGQGKTRGTAALVLQRLSCSQSVALIKPLTDQLNASYLFRNLDWRYEEIRTFSSGSGGRGVLSKPLLQIFPISIPPLEEQRRIAEILDAVDKRIDATRRVLAKIESVYEGIAAAVWQHGAEWETGYLGETASIEPGLTLGVEPSGPNSVELPYLRVANVQNGYIDTTEMKNVRILRSEISLYATRAGDVLLTEGGDFDKLGRGAVWDGRIEPCLHQNHIFRVRCRARIIVPEFLALYTSSSAGRRYFLSVAKQTTNLASINSTQLKAMPVPVPPLQDQERALRPVSEVRAQREHVAAELDKLRLLKAGLMEDLLTGRVRITPGGELTG